MKKQPMQIHVQVFNPDVSRHKIAGEPGKAGYAHWVEIGNFAQLVEFDVPNADFARKLESAARSCAEAMEAEEAVSKQSDTDPVPAPEVAAE